MPKLGVRRGVRRIAATAAIGAIAFTPANSILTQRHYAPAVRRLSTGRVRPSPAKEYAQGRKFFSANGVPMPEAPGPTQEPANYGTFVAQGLPFHKPGGDFTEAEASRIMEGVLLLHHARAPWGGSWLDYVKSAGPIITVGKTGPKAAGEMRDSGTAKPFYYFHALATEGEIAALLEYRPSLYLRGASKDGYTTIRFGVHAEDMKRDPNALAGILRSLKNRIAYAGFEPSGRYAHVRISPEHVKNASKEELARTLVHEASHGTWEQAHDVKPERAASRGSEQFAYTAGGMFIHDAARQGLLARPNAALWGNAEYTARNLASVRLGTYNRPPRAPKRANPPRNSTRR